MNKSTACSFALLVLCLFVLPEVARSAEQAAQDQAKPKRPNILLIYADDQSYKTIGCYPG